MNHDLTRDKTIAWTEKVQWKQSRFKEGELTRIGWASNRIVVPIRTGGDLKQENKEIERINP